MPTRALVTSYAEDHRRFPDMWHRVGLVAWTLAIVLFPLLASNYWLTVGNLLLVHVVGAVALMILTGFAGQISLGHAAFLAVGAYAAAVLGGNAGWPFWLILPAAGLLSAGIGLLVGPFALRLEGLYLAIVTLGLIFIVNHILLSFPGITGGVAGHAVPMNLWFDDGGSFSRDSQILGVRLRFEHKLYVLYLAIAGGTVWLASNLARSNTGRAMMAVRDHDLAATVMGIHPARAKIIAFGLSSFFAGVAGAMFGFQQQYITVDPPFNLLMSIQYIAMIVLGGIGTVFGAVAGAFAFTVLEPFAEALGPHLPGIANLSTGQQSTLIFSLVVCLMLVFEPLGIYGIWLRIKRYFMTWPFSY